MHATDNAVMDPMPPMPVGRPPSPEPVRDPIAVALGNASLLGVGYVLLRQWGLAVANWFALVVFVAILASNEQPEWLPPGLLVLGFLCWVAAIVHGWHLARRSARQDAIRTQRLIALGVLVAVVLTVGALRVDAWRTETDAAEAHRANECTRTLAILDGLWAGHRVVDPFLAPRTKQSVRACGLLLRAERQARTDRLLAAGMLRTYSAHPGALWGGANELRSDLLLTEAAEEFDSALDADTAAMAAGFELLSTVLEDEPSRSNDVGEVLDRFADRLPVEDACDTTTITDWLDSRPASGDTLDRAAEVVPRIAPTAIVECGDALLDANEPKRAQARYRQLLDQYPEHQLVSRAQDGSERAELAIQLRNVRGLLDTPSYGATPEYCRNPAPYAAAKPYHRNSGGPYPTLLFGKPEQERKLASSWTASGPRDAVLVICAGPTKHGPVVATCPYDDKLSAFGYKDVDFHNRKIPVKVYELRTGKLVTRTSVEIGGDSCPDVLRYSYTSFGSTGFDPGPPSDVYVTSSKWDVRSAYESLIDP